jgi:hypothetical protein
MHSRSEEEFSDNNAMPNAAKFAQALYALHVEGLLKDSDCKDPVILFIRQAAEPLTPRHWHATTHYRSQAAAEHLRGKTIRSQAEYHKICVSELSHEHMVPNVVVYRMICEEPNITRAYLESLLIKFGLRATITRSENEKLSRTTMPEGFFIPNHELYMNSSSRAT